MTPIDRLIKHFDMKPHPEGGFYVESFKSELNIPTNQGIRSASTAIYFLLPNGKVSHLHPALLPRRVLSIIIVDEIEGMRKRITGEDTDAETVNL